MPVLEDIKEGTDELQGCCWQLLATNHECEHTLCDGVEEVYRVGGLSIELDKCPHPGCGVCFYASPTQNLQRQDSVHHGVLAYVCGACRGIYISEGALVCHIIHGHNKPVGFERDMNVRHGKGTTQRFCTHIKHQLILSLTFLFLFKDIYLNVPHVNNKHLYCI